MYKQCKKKKKNKAQKKCLPPPAIPPASPGWAEPGGKERAGQERDCISSGHHEQNATRGLFCFYSRSLSTLVRTWAVPNMLPMVIMRGEITITLTPYSLFLSHGFCTPNMGFVVQKIME